MYTKSSLIWYKLLLSRLLIPVINCKNINLNLQILVE